jgi:RNA polymerase sigma factor (sigma-70 family)
MTDDMEKDFNVEIRVRNGRLLSAIRKKFGTMAEMSRQTGISKNEISSFVTMRKPPIGPTGITSKVALDIASALGAYFEDIWPKHMENLKRKKASFEMSMNAQEVALLSETKMEKMIEYKDAIKHLKNGLTPRELNVLHLRYHRAMTCQEVGKEIGISMTRVNEIEQKAFRKMRFRANRRNIDETIFSDAE